MADGNVEVLRRGVGAINRGDVEEMNHLTTDDVLIIAGRSAVEGSLIGRSGVREWFADTAENFEKFQLNTEDVRELGNDRVLAIGTIRIRGRGAGVETDVPFAGIATFRDGKFSRWEDFRDREHALKAAGLSR